jgi:hypothetical protein
VQTCPLRATLIAVVAMAARAQGAFLPPLSDIRAIRSVMPDDARQQRAVHIRGTVTYINERDPAGIIVPSRFNGESSRSRPSVVSPKFVVAPRAARRPAGKAQRLRPAWGWGPTRSE